MGSVYLSYTRGNQPVALLKVIRREYAQDAEFRRRFQQEVQSARRVQGYHVVPVVDHDTTGNLPWLATTYISSLPLDEAIAMCGPLPLPAALQLVGCAAEALRAVHAAGVIHRDLKPSNLLLGMSGPWVIDFGIARAADATQLTRTGGLIGTPQYMSPEHVNGRPLTPATDIFSLGLIAAVAATGCHPYGNGAAITLAAKIASTELRPPDLTGYPERLRPILERCLAVDPASRPAPAELAELCEDACGRPLRDFAGWLPEPLMSEIARREQASRQPPRPEPPAAAPGHMPMQAPPSPYVPTWPVTPVTPAWYRRPLVIIAAVWAVVVVAAAAWGFTHDWAETNSSADGQETITSPPSASTSPTDETTGSTSPTPTATARYTAIIKKKSFTIRPGARSNVDLDVPKVDPTGDSADTEGVEIQYFNSPFDTHPLDFLTTTGKSDGTTPEACKSGSETNVLPPSLHFEELTTTLRKGTVLCTVTTDGNLAMLEITGIGDDRHRPDYVTELTLWKMP
ncbi:Serine/threonine-protein kinase PknD [Streptomyces alboniger]